MPLTYVVEHLNRQLSDLHPASLIKNNSRFVYEDRKLWATVGAFHLEPRHWAVVDPASGKIVARDARLRVRDADGREHGADILYLQAWDAADVIFLDRFIRTLHALHHLDVGNAGEESLILDVHVRHLAAVPTAHGQVFEQLLDTLGLSPRQIIFRIETDLVLSMPDVLLATRNFLECGYNLLAHCEQPDGSAVATLGAIGFRWASLAPDGPGWGRSALDEWLLAARGAGIHTVGVPDTPRTGGAEFQFRTVSPETLTATHGLHSVAPTELSGQVRRSY